MDNDEQRDHIDEQYVRADLEREGREELAADLRSSAVTALRRCADWLESNLDVPAPLYIQLNAHQRGIDPDEALAACRRMADDHGATKHNNGGSRWVELSMFVDSPYPQVNYTLFANEEKRQGEQW